MDNHEGEEVAVVEGNNNGNRKGLAALRNLKTFGSFKNRIYRLYYGGMLGQMASMNMQQVAGGLLLERLTGSPAIVAAMSFANAIPMLTLSLFGGVIAERAQKKYVLLIGQICFAFTSLSVALALTTGLLSPTRHNSWMLLIISSALQGSVMGLAMPSRQAIINDIVSGEELMNAISLNFMGMNSLKLFAPALAGFLIGLGDGNNFKAVYFTMTAMYLMAVGFFFFMPKAPVKTVAERPKATAQIKEGVHYVWNHKTIRLVLLISFVTVILSMPYAMLMPFFADTILHVGARGMGIMMSIDGVGSIVASLILASLPNKRRGIIMMCAGVFLGIVLTGFAFSRHWPTSLILVTCVGMGNTVIMTMANTLIQYYVDDNYRGRVMSLFMMQFGLSSFGAFAAGLIGQAFGVQWGVGTFAMLLCVLAIVALIFIRRVRQLN